ncbi:hypothetical protein MR730_10085 [bacterium]|nr:hypothetical protein [bacterium]
MEQVLRCRLLEKTGLVLSIREKTLPPMQGAHKSKKSVASNGACGGKEFAIVVGQCFLYSEPGHFDSETPAAQAMQEAQSSFSGST